MKYIIMADGKERRWNNHQGIHKWQIRIEDQTLLERTCRLLRRRDPDALIYITSHDPQLNIEGTIRHEPLNNVLEVDRFTAELIEPDVCFLYGDVFYSDEALDTILSVKTDKVLAFGNRRSIIAVKVADAQLFRDHIHNVRTLYLNHQIGECIGWEVYHSIQAMELEGRAIGDGYILIEDGSRDFNTPQDFMEYGKCNKEVEK